VGFRIIRVITKSINLITKGTQKIRKGDFSFRIKIKSGDQLQYLAESFNEMASGIKRLLIEEKEKQRLEEELRIARSIQLKLLPGEELDTAEFEIAAVNIPAEEIAGDYFDYFYKNSGYMYILVADVSGKGTSAAFYMAELKGIVNYLQKNEISPADLISECNDSLSHSFDKATFITMNIAQFIIPDKKFILSRAGHTPAIYFNKKEKKCHALNPEGNAIGLRNFSRANIKEVEMPYRSGDILFLFSDGLSEIMNEEDEMLGIDNLKMLIAENHHLNANEIKKKILDFSIDFSDSKVNSDDLTFIILKVK
jgi:serine phosphatase RsbU (regulator of sigma subunit)